CAENETRTATALAGMNPMADTPDELAATMGATSDYVTWLAGELPAELQPNATFLIEFSTLVVTVFAGHDDFWDAMPEIMANEEDFEALNIYGFNDEYGDFDPSLAAEPIVAFLSGECGGDPVEVFDTAGQALEILDEVFEDDGDDDPFGDGGDDFPQAEYEGDLPDAPEGFCASLREEATYAFVDLMPMFGGLEGDEEPSIDVLVGLFTGMDPIYGWLVENVPAEMTADAETVRSQIADMAEMLSAIDPETATEEEIMGAIFMALLGGMAEGGEDIELPGLRLDTFLSRGCGVPMGDGPLGILEVMGGDDTGEPPPTTEPPPPTTTVDPLADALRVPDDYATIQEAVDAAAPGDLVLIGPGTYHEAVIVETDDIVIRGTDRNAVVIDGEHERENGFIVFSNGVAVENLTSHSHTSNGVFFTGDYGTDFILDGYRASYVTAYNNGLYGIYAFNATNGLIENSYGSGHPDSAFYIGQCNPCNAVVIDGEHERENGFIVFSNGVAIENLTIHSHTSNGLIFTGDYADDIIVDGYRASYVTAYNNGLYGIYAFTSTNGLIEHSYGSGHPDSAFYIGQCNPCNAVVRNVIAENNALGYSGTNASGNLIIHNSEWTGNRIGMVPNTLDSEELAPQGDIVIVGNYVHDNGNEDTPRKSADWDIGFGGGIVIAGGNDNLITRNLVTDNSFAGIALAVYPDENLWLVERNTVKDNVVGGSVHDLFLMVWDPPGGPLGNCFEGNTFETSIPADIETVAPCEGEAVAFEDNGVPNFGEFAVADHTTMAAPADQPTMPDALSAPPDAPVAPPAVDLDAIEVPTPVA
ncbi:MAG: right-handed parallel beta-helix repeat-containing protein, partial [Acidimicrobiales bacterium]|nr:right-handed parallel beta-helix repeat-containing protein [Acidimicrobiales bacterium]